MLRCDSIMLELGERLLHDRTGGTMPSKRQVLKALLFLGSQPDGDGLESMLALCVPPAFDPVLLAHADSLGMRVTDALL